LFDFGLSTRQKKTPATAPPPFRWGCWRPGGFGSLSCFFSFSSFETPLSFFLFAVCELFCVLVSLSVYLVGNPVSRPCCPTKFLPIRWKGPLHFSSDYIPLFCIIPALGPMLLFSARAFRYEIGPPFFGLFFFFFNVPVFGVTPKSSARKNPPAPDFSGRHLRVLVLSFFFSLSPRAAPPSEIFFLSFELCCCVVYELLELSAFSPLVSTTMVPILFFLIFYFGRKFPPVQVRLLPARPHVSPIFPPRYSLLFSFCRAVRLSFVFC